MRPCNRWVWWTVAAGSLAVVLLALAAVAYKQEGDAEMAKSIKALREEAATAIAANDYDGAFAVCRTLDKKPSGRIWACAIRGECFDRMGRLPEALVQYQEADALGDDTARSSAIDVIKRMQKGGK